MMAPSTFAAETSTSAATHAKSPVRISSLAFPSVLPLSPPTLCRRVRRILAAHLSFFLPQCAHSRSTAVRPVDPCAASVPFPTAEFDAPPHGDPSHVRDSSLHRPRRKRREPARPRTALSVLLRVRQQRCGAQASCPSALACLRRDARRAACVALLRRAAPNDCSGRADAARRAVRRFDKARAAGCPCRTASCGAARTDSNPRPQRWAAGSAGKGQSNAGPIARRHDAAPQLQRAHLHRPRRSWRRTRAAPGLSGGTARSSHDRAWRVGTRPREHGCEAGQHASARSPCRGDPHSDVGVGRGPFLMRRATPVGRHEKNTRWAARRPGVDCEPPERRGPWSTNTPRTGTRTKPRPQRPMTGRNWH
ncbi:hypothetical protein ERJ75_000698700 [Trypanosoma vivax]|nr:hypothetical protein ERJ75_000698700 [Trypanosoma vivax]